MDDSVRESRVAIEDIKVGSVEQWSREAPTFPIRNFLVSLLLDADSQSNAHCRLKKHFQSKPTVELIEIKEVFCQEHPRALNRICSEGESYRRRPAVKLFAYGLPPP